MSKVLVSRPVPVGLLVGPKFRRTAHNGPPPARLGPLLVAAAVGLPLLASAGVTAVALRPVSQSVTESAYCLPIEAGPLPRVVPDPEPAPVEPGEVRPTPRGVVALATDPPPEPEAAPPDPPGDRFGTAIDFVRSQSVAFAQAHREQKLVMVLHVAGNFEDPGFT